MCGLVGISSVFPLSAQEKSVFRNLLYLDVLRGEHSTGVAVVSNWLPNPKIQLFKEVGSPSELYYYQGVGPKKKDLTLETCTTMIGHNRFATQGGVNIDNAHPFEFDNVVGAHNGTLPRSDVLEFDGGKDFEVDSQALYNHIDKHSLSDAWSKTDGAMALTFYDKRDGTLHFARNSQRTLFMAVTKTNKTIIWASEAWMIEIAASREGLDIGEVTALDTNKHYIVGKDGNDFSFREEVLVPFVRPSFFRQSAGAWGRYHGSHEWEDDYPVGGQGTSNYPSKQETEKKDNKVVVLSPPKDRSSYLVIKEIHGDTNRVIAAIGRLSTGEEVRINIGLAQQTALAEQIHKQAYGNGYFVSKQVRKSAVGDGSVPFWVFYSDLQYVSLKEPFKIKWEGDKFTVPALVEEIPYVDGHKLSSRHDWEGAVEYGCDCCGAVPSWEQRKEILWVYPLMHICKTCQETPLYKMV